MYVFRYKCMFVYTYVFIFKCVFISPFLVLLKPTNRAIQFFLEIQTRKIEQKQNMNVLKDIFSIGFLILFCQIKKIGKWGKKVLRVFVKMCHMEIWKKKIHFWIQQYDGNAIFYFSKYFLGFFKNMYWIRSLLF